MLKWIFNAALIYGIYWLVKNWNSGDNRKVAGSAKKPEPESLGEELVEDPQCKVYVPKSHAIKGPGGHWFCSEKCLHEYKNRGA